MQRTSIRWPGLVLATAIIAAAGCGSSTHFISKWNGGGAQPVSIAGLRVAAVFVNDNESIRREGEDVMVREVGRIGGIGVASYDILPTDPKDRERAKAELAKAGVDAVLSMRVVTRDRIMDSNTYFTGSAHYGNLWNYWGYGWGNMYGGGYVNSNVIVAVETLLYSLRDEKLLWAGMSETFDPDDVASAVKSIAREAVDEMQDDGVLFDQ